jgi:hypothetical protein
VTAFRTPDERFDALTDDCLAVLRRHLPSLG